MNHEKRGESIMDRRYHFPGGVRDGLPRQFPAPDAAPRVCRERRQGFPDGYGPENGPDDAKKRKIKPENGEKWTDCHLSNGGMLV